MKRVCPGLQRAVLLLCCGSRIALQLPQLAGGQVPVQVWGHTEGWWPGLGHGAAPPGWFAWLQPVCCGAGTEACAGLRGCRTRRLHRQQTASLGGMQTSLGEGQKSFRETASLPAPAPSLRCSATSCLLLGIYKAVGSLAAKKLLG